MKPVQVHLDVLGLLLVELVRLRNVVSQLSHDLYHPSISTGQLDKVLKHKQALVITQMEDISHMEAAIMHQHSPVQNSRYVHKKAGGLSLTYLSGASLVQGVDDTRYFHSVQQKHCIDTRIPCAKRRIHHNCIKFCKNKSTRISPLFLLYSCQLHDTRRYIHLAHTYLISTSLH